MKVVIASATEKEIIQVKQTLTANGKTSDPGLQISFYETGVGILSACFSITNLIYQEKPDLVIQAGIAGCFDTNIALGSVVVVKEEFLGDMGAEEDGDFRDLFDLNLQMDLFPFANKGLRNPHLPHNNLLGWNEVSAVTINEISTRAGRIEQLKHKYGPVIESMEGAALHYCCLQNHIPFLQLRAISNYIGVRDKSRWNFIDSLTNLSANLIAYLEHLDKIGTY